MRSDVVDIIDELVKRIEQLESENEDLSRDISQYYYLMKANRI